MRNPQFYVSGKRPIAIQKIEDIKTRPVEPRFQHSVVQSISSCKLMTIIKYLFLQSHIREHHRDNRKEKDNANSDRILGLVTEKILI